MLLPGVEAPVPRPSGRRRPREGPAPREGPDPPPRDGEPPWLPKELPELPEPPDPRVPRASKEPPEAAPAPAPAWRAGAGPRDAAPPRFCVAPPRSTRMPPRPEPPRAAACIARSAGVDRRRIGSARTERSGSKPGDHLGRDRAAQEGLDVAQERRLVHAHERDRLAVGARAAGPTDAVDVVLGDHRQLVVDDVGQLLDVEAAGGDVGRHEDGDAALLEVGQRLDPLGLALVAVDRGGVDAVA